jgi:hypothetical protein
MLLLPLPVNSYAHFSSDHDHIVSTCSHCKRMVGSSMWEAELESLEAVHVCPGTSRHRLDTNSVRVSRPGRRTDGKATAATI